MPLTPAGNRCRGDEQAVNRLSRLLIDLPPWRGAGVCGRGDDDPGKRMTMSVRWRVEPARRGRGRRPRPARAGRVLALLGLACLLAGPAGAATARVQYNQGVDENLVPAVAQSLGSDRTLHFRYDPEFADDHVFPNGVTMWQFHAWVTQLITVWNQQPLMPLRLSVERGSTDAPNTITLDEAGHDTGR